MDFPSGCQGQKLNRPTFYFMRNASVGGRVDAQRETTSAVAQRECPREDRHGASVEGKSDHTTHILRFAVHSRHWRSLDAHQISRRGECCVQRGPNPDFQLFEPKFHIAS
jgi:hypothetical protein